MPAPRKRVQLRFDPNEVEPLLRLARSGSDTETIQIVDKYGLPKILVGSESARAELLERFQRLVVSLVRLCITGRINPRSGSHTKFLQMFGGKDTPPQKVANMLKNDLASIDKEELYRTGQLAIFEAIKKSKENFAATVVICFKDEVHSLTRHRIEAHAAQYTDCELTQCLPFEDMAFEIFIEALPEEDWIIARAIIDGEDLPKDGDGNPLPIPSSLREALAEYMDRDDLWAAIDEEYDMENETSDV